MPPVDPWELMAVLLLVVVILIAGRVADIIGRYRRIRKAATAERARRRVRPAPVAAPPAVAAAPAAVIEAPAPVVENKCPSCGTNNPPTQVFCGQCGTRLTRAA